MFFLGGPFFNILAQMQERVLFRDYDYNQSTWTGLAGTTADAVEGLLILLRKSAVGRGLILKARAKALESDRDLKEIVEAGNETVTDTTFVRKSVFEAGEFQTNYIEISRIILNKDLSIEDAVINLAHELTHFIFRHQNNPYQEIDLKSFISNTIDGIGGEVDATMVECRVIKELFQRRFVEDIACQRIIVDQERSTSTVRSEGLKEFYKVGDYWPQIEQLFRKYNLSMADFPLLSKRQPLYFSGQYGVPYPLAAIKEYQKLVQKICTNEEIRLQKIKEEKKLSDQDPLYLELQNKYLRKCQFL